MAEGITESKYSITKLNGENYFTWKYKLKLLLIEKGVWSSIAGEKPSPVTAEWTRNDEKAQSAIGLNVDDMQIHLIRECISAKDVWNTLKDFYEKDTPSNRLHIVRKIMTSKLEEGGDAEKHITKMTELFQRLFALGDMDPEFFKSAALLGSLPESYDSLIIALEARTNSSELNSKVVSEKIVSEYRRRKEKGLYDAKDESALKVNITYKNSEDRTCYFCKQPGHIRNKCVKYREWLREKKSQDSEKTQKANLVTNTGSEEYLFLTNVSSGWLIDSGATCHVVKSKENFVSFSENNRDNVNTYGKTKLSSKGIGTICMKVLNEFQHISSVKVPNVLYVPDGGGNLLSVSKLTDAGFMVIFEKNTCKIYAENGTKQIAIGDKIDRLYKLREVQRANLVQDDVAAKCVHFWHKTLGHRDMQVVKNLQASGLVQDFKLTGCTNECNDNECEICLEGKITRAKFPKESLNSSEEVLDLVHSDICGPMQTVSPSGKRYILTFIDDKSKFTKIFLITNKNEALGKFKEFVEAAKTKFGRKVKNIRSDRGGEYTGNDFLAYLAKEGIGNQRTAPYTPQQNGIAERKNRTLVEMARCMLLDGKCGNEFWAEAVTMANYVQNRLPAKGIDKTPFEMWNGSKPNISHFMMFGARCFVHVPHQKRRKLDPTGMAGKLVGYDESSKAYRIYVPSTRKVIISRDVKFVDKHEMWSDEMGNKAAEINETTFENVIDMHSQIQAHDNDERDASEHGESEHGENEVPMLSDDDSDQFVDAEQEPEIVEEPQIVVRDGRRSSRVNKGVPPKRLIEEINMVCTEPKTYNQAISGNDRTNWMSAMKDEINSLHENGTWELIDLPRDVKPIGCKWLYKIKTDENGNTVRYKARLVAQGYSQKYGSDYDQVFAPVAKLTTLRIVLSLANKNGWYINHVDAKTAFLNGKLEEIIYMKQPPGFVSEGNENKVCILKKSLYGLKQAARSWNQALHDVLVKSGFVQSKADPCLYFQEENQLYTYIIIYVDDMSIISKSEAAIGKTTEILKAHFKIQNLGNIKYYLGLEITRDNGGNYAISQTKYINQVVEQYGLKDAKVSNVPLSVGYGKENGDNDDLLPDNDNYRKLIGCLLYIAVNTRPDIAASVSILAQKVSCPTQNDWLELKRVLKYLKGTKDLKLALSSIKQNGTCHAYADANWAEDKHDRKSNTGYIVFVCGGAVSWCSKKQSCVALSSTEAEFMALSEAAKEVIWIRRLLIELGEKFEMPTIIYEDNQSCLKLIENEKLSNRSKHIDTKKFFVKDHVDNGNINCKYCPTEEMIGDLMTKPLAAARIQKLANGCGLFN